MPCKLFEPLWSASMPCLSYHEGCRRCSTCCRRRANSQGRSFLVFPDGGGKELNLDSMHRRPSAVASPLSPLAPQPLTPRRGYSAASQVSSPHTPPNRDSPLPLLAPASNRQSGDSWNSSIHDGADDDVTEWTQEQTRLLSRTLDALPAHLLTPFNGAVPPSNLLDKLARRVADAKGPGGWPHSIRATRAKIVELARIRAKEAATDGASDTIAEEDSSDPDVLQSANPGPKRPLYRQSSMDFMQIDKNGIMENDNLRRLSRRLQRAERIIPSYHPYAGFSRSSSPIHKHALSSTASSSTLNSINSDDREAHGRERRSMSDMSNSSESFILPAIDPRVQRVKRAESFAGMLCPPGHLLKRAPSYGASSRRSSGAMSISGKDSDVTSSDEEEKLRSLKAKKARVKATSPSPVGSSPPVILEHPKSSKKSTPLPSNKASKTSNDASVKRSNRPKANLQRNPSILGGELPRLQPTIETPLPSIPARDTPTVNTSASTAASSSPHRARKSRRTPKISDTPVATGGNSSASSVPNTPATNDRPCKPLRRSRGVHLPDRTVARKISFTNLAEASAENNVNTGLGLGLESRASLGPLRSSIPPFQCAIYISSHCMRINLRCPTLAVCVSRMFVGVITRWLVLQVPRISSDLTELLGVYDIGYPVYRLLRCNCLCALLSPLSNLCTLLCKKYARPLIPSVRPVSYEAKCAHGKGVTTQMLRFMIASWPKRAPRPNSEKPTILENSDMAARMRADGETILERKRHVQKREYAWEKIHEVDCGRPPRAAGAHCTPCPLRSCAACSPIYPHIHIATCRKMSDTKEPSPEVLQKLATAKEKKDAGDQAFKAGEVKNAPHTHKALMYLNGIDKNALSPMTAITSGSIVDGAANEQKKKTEADEILEKVYSNMAACHLKQSNWKRAIETADKAIAQNADCYKALFRKAKALGELGFFEKAEKILEDLLKKDEADAPTLNAELARLRAVDKEREKAHNQKFKGFLNREKKTAEAFA
ncbi:predicted protein [Postia placenta Mad-698-R]|nr:predicted protein [Postia placenta Mad-698-R]